MTIAIYVRLSLEDGTEQESASIVNQRHLLLDFIRNTPDLYGAKVVEFSDGSVIIGLNQSKLCGTRGCAGFVLFYFQMIWGDTTNFNNHSVPFQAPSATD